jgi:hypothetical protein
LAHCDYWWFAGGVEWCDLEGSNCHCGGWEDSCALKRRRKKSTHTNDMQMMSEMEEHHRKHKQNHIRH